MDKPTSNLIRKHLEEMLSDRIQDVYRTQLGYAPKQVSCRLFDNKLAIVLDDAISRPVQILVENNHGNLAQQAKLNIDAAIKPQLVQVIEEVVGINVIDWLSDTTIETGRTGTIAVLANAPLWEN